MTSFLFFVSGVWEGGHGGRNTYQPKQQLPDVPSGGAASLQVESLSLLTAAVFGRSSALKRLLFVHQVCHWGGVAGDHAGLHAGQTVRPRVGLQPWRGDDVWQRIRHHLFHHLLHALRLPGTHSLIGSWNFSFKNSLRQSS